MNNILIILLFIITNHCFAQTPDSIIDKSNKVVVTKNLHTNRYTIKAQQTYSNLKFVRRIYRAFQVLDANNQLFYIDKDGQKQTETQDFFWGCGTVPHYILSIQKTATHFEIFEDETFYDNGNQIPAEKKTRVSLVEADSVLFINGRSTFDFTANFGMGISTTNPRWLILMKNGKYYTRNNPDLKFDSILFRYHQQHLITIKNNRYGILGVIQPKYKQIEVFQDYLAKAEKENGQIVYIDTDGNEY